MVLQRIENIDEDKEKMVKKLRLLFIAFSCFILIGMIAKSAIASTDCVGSDYPTSAKVDYVLACMAANGQTPEMLGRCSCSIDEISTFLTYEEYVQADTVLRTQLSAGQRGVFFRTSTWAKEITDKLQEAQAVSTLNCF